jgi:hypothetical protein
MPTHTITIITSNTSHSAGLQENAQSLSESHCMHILSTVVTECCFGISKLLVFINSLICYLLIFIDKKIFPFKKSAKGNAEKYRPWNDMKSEETIMA